jgi:hypothetical protein
MQRSPWISYLCLASAMALVGSYVGLSKVLVLVFPIFLLAWLRFGIAALAMASWVRRAPGEAPLNAHDRKLLFFESFFGNFLFSICMLFGVSMTSALAAGVIMAGHTRRWWHSCRGAFCTSASRGAWRSASPAPWPASRWCRSPSMPMAPPPPRCSATCCCFAP